MRRPTMYALTVACAIALTATAWVYAQDKKGAAQTIKSKSVRTRGADSNIKQAQVKNVEGKPAPAPPGKGGAKTRGQAAVGILHVDSRSGYYVDVYLDGRAAGTVGPWGDLYVGCTATTWEFYARAPGTSHTWGPSTIRIPADGTHHLKLYD